MKVEYKEKENVLLYKNGTIHIWHGGWYFVDFGQKFNFLRTSNHKEKNDILAVFVLVDVLDMLDGSDHLEKKIAWYREKGTCYHLTFYLSDIKEAFRCIPGKLYLYPGEKKEKR